MKIFGTITLDSTMKRWVIECEPHVAKQLKRWFPRIDETQRGIIHLADTDANGRELLWITERFPMAVVPDDYLRARAENQLRTEAAVQEVLKLDYTPPTFDLAIPPRPYQAQAAALLLKNGAVLLADDLGLGKAQPLDARVLTPHGWVTMGSLEVGDEVIDPSGGTATVTGVFPQGEREVFRVKTADGATTECCDEHLWEVRTPNDRKRGGSRVLPLSEIRSRLHYTYPGQRTSRFFLPTCEPVQYAPAGQLPVDPYLLGVLIGDGCMKAAPCSVMLSTADDEILTAVRDALPSGVHLVKADGYDWRLSSAGPENPLSRKLRSLDMLGRRSWEKYIPTTYLRATAEDRLALLQGLMDTDGTCGSDGVTTYTTTSTDLAREVAELVGSLGGFASTYSRQPKYTYKGEKRTGRRAYTLNVRMPVCPFRLAKKKARWHRPYLARAIQEVTSVGTKPVQCIRVSSKRSLYITDGFIVTHNTVSAICAMADKRALPCVVVTMTHLPIQWRRELARFAPKLTVHVVRGGPVYDVRSFGRYPDVVIVPYSKLAKWATALAPHAKYVVFDEVQELRRHDSQKYAAACELRENAAYTLGLSVAPDSRVELRGGPFAEGWVGGIEDAWKVVGTTPSTELGYEIVRPAGVQSRGWDGQRFTWKPVRSFLRHTCNKDMVRVKLGGRKVDTTVDHCVYVATATGLSCPRADQMQVGDVVPMDDGNSWDGGQETPFDVAAMYSGYPYAQINLPVRKYTRHHFGLNAWQWQNMWKSAHGPRLPLKTYLRHKDKFPVTGPVYAGRGPSPQMPRLVHLSSMAYLLGFYIGDGWVSGDRVAFAVEDARVNGFVNELRNLPFEVRPSVRRMRGASCEVRFSHSIMAAMLRAITGSALCHEKRIPGPWITTWGEAARRELVRGLLDSDGHYGNKGTEGRPRAYITTSAGLAEDVRTLLRSLGTPSSILAREPRTGGVVRGRQIQGRRVSYHVHWNGNMDSGKKGPRYSLTWTRGVMHEARVTAVTPLPRPEWVYDLEMDGHPSFVANGILVHNTATPVMNYGGDFYNVMNVIKEDCLGTRVEFSREWATNDVTGMSGKLVIADPQALGTYMRTTGLMLRRQYGDAGIPTPQVETIVHEIECDEDTIEAAEGRASELARIILDQTAMGFDKLRASEELNHLMRQATGIAKGVYVAAFVRALVESGEPVVLAGWHRAVYEIWLEKLKDLNPLMYTGSESPAQKQRMRDAFVEGKSNLLVMSLRSGAGLDGLQERCRVAVFGELDWSPGIHKQLLGRLARFGQTKPVMGYYLTADCGSDPVVSDVLGLKAAQADGIMDPDKEVLEQQAVDTNRIKNLARAVLENMGRR